MINIFKENKRLKKEIENLNKIIKDDSNESYKRIETESFLRGRIDDLLDKQVLLQKEIVEIARDYINKIGGFENFAEWGLY